MKMKRILFNLWYFRKPPWDTGISPPELLAFLESHPPGRALDLGCGTGTNVITLAQHGWQATGVDFALRAVQQARRKARRAGVTARFLVDSVTRLEGVQGPFDLVLDIGCFHNLSLTEKGDYLRSLERLLAPGGTYLLYAFFKGSSEPGSLETGSGLYESDLTALSTRFRLVDRQDGFNRRTRPSAWFTFEK